MRHKRTDPARRDWCQWSRCKSPSALIYYGAGVCGRHWEAICQLQDDHPMAEAATIIVAKLGLTPDDLNGS